MDHTEPQIADPRLSLDAAQLEKLKLEITALRKRSAWRDTLLQLIPAITVMIALGGFLFGVYQFHEGQQKSRETEQAGQRIKMQEQIRNDLDRIVQFPTEKKETVSQISFLLLDLDNLLKPSLGNSESISGDRRKISDLLVQLVSDDTDLSERRNVDFAITIAKRWDDYNEHLKANPKLVVNILMNHCDALEGLHKRNPKYFGQLKYAESRTEFDDPDNITPPDATVVRHFEDLVASYSRHLKLIQDPTLRQFAVKQFQAAICNRSLTEQEFGESFDPKQDWKAFSTCPKS